MKFRNTKEYVLLDICTSNTTSGFAYPETEKDGMYFWFRLLDRFGLVYLCTPKSERAPDAYFVYRSKLDGRARRLIQEGLKAGRLDPALLDEGIVLGIEFESDASYAKKHFEHDGLDRISVICCNRNNWRDAPVPVWSLQDHLGVLEESQVREIQPPIPDTVDTRFDEEEYRRIWKSLKRDTQRLVLMAFLIERIPSQTEDELALPAPSIKANANWIAERNNLPQIQDIGGVLTAFTQDGIKKDIGLLRKGRQVERGSMYYFPVRFIPYIERMASELGWQWKGITHVR